MKRRMKRQKVEKSKSRNLWHRFSTGVFALLGLSLAISAGCQELVHMGQISDREGAFCIGGVKIEQFQADGSWAQLGVTDGNGRWWILKEKMRGGGKIRMSKPGYYPIVMSDSEFLQQVNLVMTPTDTAGGFGEPSRDFGSSPSPR